NSFFDNQTSLSNKACGNCEGGFSRNTNEMKNILTYFNKGWFINYTRSHNLNNGYPFLAWQVNNNNFDWLIYSDEDHDISYFCGGSGTKDDPYQICTCQQLQNMRLNLTAHYKIMNDIDCSATINWNSGQGFEPIGFSRHISFNGTLNGQNYKIINLYINRPSQDYVGLFGYSFGGGRIGNLTLINSSIKGKDYVGGLVGYSDRKSEVSNFFYGGKVEGRNFIGGISGFSFYENIFSNVSSSGNISGNSFLGGLIGYSFSYLLNSYSFANVSGVFGLGGLVGVYGDGPIKNSYYNFNKTFINERNAITIGALYEEDFNEWFNNNKFINISTRLTREDDYYLINNISDFKQLLIFGQGLPSSTFKFKLNNDLDLSNENDFYIPYLSGEFDGRYNNISNVNVNLSFLVGGGVFGVIFKANVSNLIIGGGSYLGRRFIGGLTGYNAWSNIVNSSNGLNVSGIEHVGGLVGFNIGGVSNSFNEGQVSGSSNVGGIIGTNRAFFAGNVTNVYNKGRVSGSSNVGGIVGFNGDFINIRNSFNNGRVSSTNQIVGGLVGINKGDIFNSYNTGNVSGNSSVGGLVGAYLNGTISNSYFSKGPNNGNGIYEPNQSFYKNISHSVYSSWNISLSTYNLNNGYPFLAWQVNNSSSVWLLNPNADPEAIDIFECLVINEPGNYVLQNNLQSVGDCIVINANNVFLNMNSKRVSSSQGSGVLSIGKNNVTITNGLLNNSFKGVSFSGMSNSLIIMVNFTNNSLALNLSGFNNIVNNSFFVNNLKAVESLGNNSLIFSNEFGEIRWNGNLDVGGVVDGFTKYSRLNFDSISFSKGRVVVEDLLLIDNPSLNSSVHVRFNDSYRDNFLDRYLKMGVSGKPCNSITIPTCINTTSLKSSPILFNVSPHIGNGEIAVGFFPGKVKRIDLYKGWNFISFTDPNLEKDQNESEVLGEINISLSKGWNLIGYPTPYEKDFRESVFINGTPLINASREGIIKGGLIYYNKVGQEENPSFKYVGVSGSGESILREARGYYIYAEENNTILTYRRVIPIEHQNRTNSYKIRIGDIHFINKSSGEVRNITRAVEPENVSQWIGQTYRGWFGSCRPYLTDRGSLRENCTGTSTIYWWDARMYGEGKGDFGTKPYNSLEEIDASKGVFVKFNYPDLAILLPGE
ncbi:MAG: hypothetical protein QW103_01415, partial [Candidatus Pacearchaeota archaeon]